MRRFEFVEGTSSKFWEIGLEGSGFTVRFGRLGTEGQTQQKSFPTAEKARAEHDKLIQEKQKKGYAEVGAATAPPAAPAKAPHTRAPAPSPEPAEPAAAARETAPPLPAEDDLPPIHWEAAYLRRVHPRRGGQRVPVKKARPAQQAWKAVRDAVARVQDTLIVEPADDVALASAVAAVRARVASEQPSAGSVEEDAILLTLVHCRTTYFDRPDFESGVDLLFSLGGPVHAVCSVLGSFAFNTTARQQPGPVTLARGAHDRYAWMDRLEFPGLRGLTRLRELLVNETDEAGYAAARAAVDFDALTPEQRGPAAYLFPDRGDWLQTALAGPPAYAELAYLVLSAQDDAALQAVINATRAYNLLRPNADVLPTLLDVFGPRLLPFLEAVAPHLPGADAARAWSEALARINTDAAMALLLDRLDKNVLPAATELVSRSPRRALRLLAERAAVRGKAGDLARALLDGLLRQAGPALADDLARLPPTARRAAESLLAPAGSDLPDAPLERLPPVLAQPPWKAGRKAAALPVLDRVDVSAPADALAWLPGEREAWAPAQHREYGEQYSKWGPAEWKAYALEPHPVRGPSFYLYAPTELVRAHAGQWEGGAWSLEAWLRAIVARHELAAVPLVLQHVDERGVESLGFLAPFAVASLAPRMADALVRSKRGRDAARAWLLRHPDAAVAGLLPLALGTAGRAKDDAATALRLLAAAGHRARILDAAARSAREARPAAEAVLDFDPLLRFPTRLPKLPDFADAAALPRPQLADRTARLPVDATAALLTMLAFTSADEPYAGLAQVKAACDARSLAELAWALFERWLMVGAPSKEGWALQALGLLGDDEVARRLAPLIREWPGEAAHARAVAGLDVLAAIGTDVTLTYLNAIAEKAKFKGLQTKAQEKIALIAEARGLTREELADRLVPNLGLEPDGSLVLDYGERRFTVGFDEALKPYVKDADGSRLKDLPKPTKKDDPEKAGQAEARWKALKKDAKAVAALQVLRLELGMCAQRRWSVEVFRRFFVEHPLLVHVVRRLVWGVYGADGVLGTTFRVAEDRSLADANDALFELPEDARVGLPHPLELDAATAAAWGQVLSDYQLLQPFAQLGRPTFSPTSEEAGARELTRLKGLKVPTGKVLGLEARGWRRGPALDAGVVGWMVRVLEDGREVQLALDPGLYTGMLSESPEQTLGGATVGPHEDWGHERGEPLSTLGAVAFSELVRDLEGLRAQGS